MYQILARNALKIFLETGTIPSLADVGMVEHADTKTRNSVFVTLYKDGTVVGSSGRVHVLQSNTISECIDNTILALRDARATSVTAMDLGSMKIRVDVIAPNDRRVMATYTELNPREEGIILLSQNLGKLAVILPKIISPDITAKEIFEVACKKANMSPVQDSADYVLYALRSKEYNDFV